MKPVSTTVLQHMAGKNKEPFDTESYLKSRFDAVNLSDRVLFQLENYHESFQSLPHSLRVLDYGTGPVILSVISAARYASEIVLSDISESNREALRKWLRKDVTAFDWSSYIDHVVQKLEGQGEKEAREREERLREVVKDVAYCGIEEDPPIKTACRGPYDVVINNMCLGAACHTKEDFVKGVAKLAALLKPGGMLLSMSSERKMDQCVAGYYTVGSQHLPALNITGEYIVGVLEQQGLSKIILKRCKISPDATEGFQNEDFLGYVFTTAKKKL